MNKNPFGAGSARRMLSLYFLIVTTAVAGCAMPRERATEPISSQPAVATELDTLSEAGTVTVDAVAEPEDVSDERGLHAARDRDQAESGPSVAPQSSGAPKALAGADTSERSIILADMVRRSHHEAMSSQRIGQGSIAQGSFAQRNVAQGNVAQYMIAPPQHLSLPPEFHTEQYDYRAETGFRDVAHSPLSTFSIDVDTASYSNVRRFLSDGALPSVGAVRIEELVNYFDYDYPDPSEDRPLSVTTELASAPWNLQHQLLMVGLRGRSILAERVPPRNLVFLIDVSGSMNSPDKLPLVKAGLRKLAREVRSEDRISIVVYAGASGLVLEPTSGRDREQIEAAIEGLGAGGSTNGAEGIRLAYQTARRHFDPEAVNRVILATDGDFNVGTSSRDELVRLIEEERKSGVYLTVLGVGTGNLKDATMEELADHGNGNYAYLDTVAEARKVLVEEAGSTLVTIAKDVKIQIEFNPKAVASYRLIGYENRRLAGRDFNDDTKDAGEIGAGHTVTALYELVPAGTPLPGPGIDPLRYGSDGEGEQRPQAHEEHRYVLADELATIKLRYKRAGAGEAASGSDLITERVVRDDRDMDDASSNLRFAAAVTAFGMVLTDSQHRGDASFAMAGRLAKSALGADPHAYRAEFLRLVAIAEGLEPRARLE